VITVDIHVEHGDVQKCVCSAYFNFVIDLWLSLFLKIGLWPAAWLKILYVALGLKRLPVTGVVGALLQYFSPLCLLCLLSNTYSVMRYD